MADLSIKLFKKKMKNPLVLASGVLGITKKGLERTADAGAAALTTKSLSAEPRGGHAGPNIIETECGLLNAMGYPNQAIDEGIGEFSGWKRKELLIISITGKDAEEFGMLASKVEAAKKELGATAVEAVLSCPHTPEYGLLAGQNTKEGVRKITGEVKSACSLPLIVKLSPSVPGEVGLAKEAEKAGADAINMGNSAGPGMKIDIERKSPVLGFSRGGLSGPAIKPLAVRCVYDICKAVDIPVIGTGGISTGEDVIEMMMAGAAAAGVGTSVYYRGREVFQQIAKEAEEWLDSHHYKSMNDIKGAAHE